MNGTKCEKKNGNLHSDQFFCYFELPDTFNYSKGCLGLVFNRPGHHRQLTDHWIDEKLKHSSKISQIRLIPARVPEMRKNPENQRFFEADSSVEAPFGLPFHFRAVPSASQVSSVGKISEPSNKFLLTNKLIFRLSWNLLPPAPKGTKIEKILGNHRFSEIFSVLVLFG